MIKRIDIIQLSLILLFAIAGFSQIKLNGIKPSDLIIMFTFFSFFIKGKLKIKPLSLFFIISIIYGWLIGGLGDLKTATSNIVLFLLMFSFMEYFREIPRDKILTYLKYFTLSMFISNLLAIVIFLFIPSLRELVVDTSSAGLRLKGFFNQTNAYAFILLLNFPISLYFLKHRTNFFNILNIFLVVICLLFSQSRGAIFSLLVGYILIYSLYLIKTKKVKKIIFPSVFLFLFGFILITILPEYLQNQFGINLERINPTVQKDFNRSITDISVSNLESDRSNLINAGLETIMNFPFGLGYQPQHTIIGDLTGVYFIPHNYYLTLILTYGILFGSIWILIIWLFLYKGIRTLYSEIIDPGHLYFYLILTIVVVGLYYITHSPEWSYLYFFLAIFIAEMKKLRPIF